MYLSVEYMHTLNQVGTVLTCKSLIESDNEFGLMDLFIVKKYSSAFYISNK